MRLTPIALLLSTILIVTALPTHSTPERPQSAPGHPHSPHEDPKRPQSAPGRPLSPSEHSPSEYSPSERFDSVTPPHPPAKQYPPIGRLSFPVATNKNAPEKPEEAVSFHREWHQFHIDNRKGYHGDARQYSRKAKRGSFEDAAWARHYSGINQQIARGHSSCARYHQKRLERLEKEHPGLFPGTAAAPPVSQPPHHHPGSMPERRVPPYPYPPNIEHFGQSQTFPPPQMFPSPQTSQPYPPPYPAPHQETFLSTYQAGMQQPSVVTQHFLPQQVMIPNPVHGGLPQQPHQLSPPAPAIVHMERNDLNDTGRIV